MRMMILGAGYSGKAIAAEAISAGAEVSGTSRSPDKLERLGAVGIRPLLFDGLELSDVLKESMATTTHLVQSIAPGRDGDPLLRLAQGVLGELMPRLQWIGYLSTVGVYGDHRGGWVDEDTPCKPVSDRSVERIEAEEAWTQAGASLGVPVALLRLSGIYGPGRNAFMNLSNGTARRLVKPDQVFNRIRVEDIGRATLFLASRGLGSIYNVTDNEPCPPQDVVTEAARLMGVAAPAEQPFETADLSPMARSFYGENKRVSNKRLRDLGFDFRFPDYRMSLAHLWSSGGWNV